VEATNPLGAPELGRHHGAQPLCLGVVEVAALGQQLGVVTEHEEHAVGEAVGHVGLGQAGAELLDRDVTEEGDVVPSGHGGGCS
jgi:hypothetical protein